jgi:hypothetical protein
MRKLTLKTVATWYVAVLATTVGCAFAAKPAQAAPPSTRVISSQEQQPTAQPTSQTTQHTDHTIKIWTNDELISSRTPADRYIFAKEEKAAADQAAAFQSLTSCFAPEHREPTLEETQQAIADTTQSIREGEDGLAQAKRQVAEDPENLRTRDQAELNRRTAELNQLLEHLHVLQARLQESTPSAVAPPAAPSADLSAPSPQP